MNTIYNNTKTNFRQNNISGWFILFMLTTILSVELYAVNPDKDAVYKQITRDYTLKSDGSWSLAYSHTLKINTYYAFHTLHGEDFIVYDPNYQNLEINKSVTTMADGTQVASPANAFNELLPSFAANVPAYNRLREMVVTHTALERGASIDFAYTLSVKPGFAPAFFASEILPAYSPIEKYTLKVRVAQGVAFNYKTFNTSEPSVSKSGENTIYTWVLTDIPAQLREDFKPRDLQYMPRVVLAVNPKKSSLFSRLAAQFVCNTPLPECIVNYIDEALRACESPYQKTYKIQEIVANELNNWQIPLSYSAYKVRTPHEIWKSNGGTEAEKALLMCALLQSQKIDAVPVVTVASDLALTKIFSPACIDHFYVKVSFPGTEPVYLSPVSADFQDKRFQFIGKKLLLTGISAKEKFYPIPEVSNRFAVSGTLKMGDNKELNSTLRLELGGRLNPWLRFVKDTAFYSSFLSGALGNATAKNIRPGQQDSDFSTWNFESTFKSSITEKAGHYFVKVPVAPAGSESWHLTELPTDRYAPVEIPFPVTEQYDFTIELPDTLQMITPVVKTEHKFDFGTISQSIQYDNNRVRIERVLQINRAVIKPEEYTNLREMMGEWNSRKYREIVLKNK